MRIEAAAYASRWRDIAPVAKGLFAACGTLAACLAQHAATQAVIAAILVLAALLGARVPLRSYLAAALPPLGFLALSCLTMQLAIDADGNWHWLAQVAPGLARTAWRSVATLAALLGFVLTTPMPDLIMLLRRLHTPALLLDLMVLCYRMVFVMQQAWRDGVTAQSARLGHHTVRLSWRSTGLLAGQMAVQVWQRGAALHMAAEARGYQGTLRFLPTVFAHARRHTAYAGIAGAMLVALALGESW